MGLSSVSPVSLSVSRDPQCSPPPTPAPRSCFLCISPLARAGSHSFLGLPCWWSLKKDTVGKVQEEGAKLGPDSNCQS